MVRRDLPLGTIAAQVTHAAGASASAWSLYNQKSLDEETRAVVLEVPDEEALSLLVSDLRSEGVPAVEVREPDPPYLGALMAVGVHPLPCRMRGGALRRLRLLGYQQKENSSCK